MRYWETDYKGHRIRVENELFTERLIIDGVLQDTGKGPASRRTLNGKVADASGSTEPVAAELAEGRDEAAACRISVSGHVVYSSPNARNSGG